MIVWLIRFLQDTYSHVLLEELQIWLSEANEVDRGLQTKAGASLKHRDASKAVIFDALDFIYQKDASTFPINFEEFSFNILLGFGRHLTRPWS